MTTTTLNAILTPYKRLEANYGKGLAELNSEAVLEAIALISLSVCGDNQPSRIANCGSFYSNFLSFHTLALVVCDDSLDRSDLLTLLRKLSECI